MDIVKNTRKKVETSKKKLAKTIELKSYRKLAVNFLILTVNLIIIILYFSLSQAKVQIIPAQETVTHSVPIKIAQNPSPSDGSLALDGSTTTAEAAHSQEFTIRSSGTRDAQAAGTLTIRNTTDRDQIFVANTRFANQEGTLLKTKNQVTVPGSGQITVAAYADEPGISGEVTAAAGRFQVVALPYLKDKIYAEILEPFAGGTVPVRELTQEAYSAAQKEVEEALLEKGAQQLSETLSADIEPGNRALEIRELRATAKPGDRDLQTFTITAKGTVSALSYDTGQAREIVKQELAKKVPPDKMLVTFDEDSFTAVANEDGASVTASINAELAPKIPEAALSQEDIIGLNEEEVRLHFTKITGIKDVQIEFWPFWVRSVPNLKDHIEIVIKR